MCGRKIFHPTTSGRDDKHGRGMPRPYDRATTGGRPYISCRVCLLVLADETNNDALLALIPIKGDSNGIARILIAPRSDVLM